MKLSVLILRIPERRDPPILRQLCEQAEDLPAEVLWLGDNRRRSIGAKRQGLLWLAQGEYCCFLDDDDDVADDFLDTLLPHLDGVNDVVTYDTEARYVDGRPSMIVVSAIGNPNEQACPGQTIMRAAWHTHCWRTGLARRATFPDTSYAEDWAWASQLQALVTVSHHVPRVLHYYTFR